MKTEQKIESNAKEALEKLEELLGAYKELCDDVGDNDIQYEIWNLTSPYHTIKKNLEALREYEKRNE